MKTGEVDVLAVCPNCFPLVINLVRLEPDDEGDYKCPSCGSVYDDTD